MSSQPAGAETLRSEIARARNLFGSFRVRRDHVLVDKTVARFLWWAMADAELILLASERNRTQALAPVFRHLLETTHDIVHLVAVAGDRERFAAGTLVGELLDSAARALERVELAKKEPSLAPPSDWEEPLALEERFEEIFDALEALGQDTSILRHVSEEFRDSGRGKRGVHCTRQGRVDLIGEISKRFAEERGELTEARQFEWLWRQTSASGRAHSSPGWVTLRVELDDTGRLHPDPTIRHLAKVASNAASLLNIANNLIEWYAQSRDQR